MFGPLGFWELVFILGLALLIFGPRKLPEVGRTLGKSMGEFRRATTDLKRTIEREFESVDDEKPSLSTTRSAPKPSPSTPFAAPPVEDDTDSATSSSASSSGPSGEPDESAAADESGAGAEEAAEPATTST